jgi:hypothetical protein
MRAAAKFRTGAAIGLAVAASAVPAQAAQSRSSLTCTWAGTHDAPTGTFTVRPGVTNVPSAGPLAFMATGRLAGNSRCHGTMTFVGQLDTGATCPFSTFRGRVRGLPGVARFEGRGGGVDVPSLLYDRNGRVVGVENADIMTQANFPHTTDCLTPQGFTGGWPGMFSSVVERFG